MKEFRPGDYAIVRDGGAEVSGPFTSSAEILGFIARKLPPGVYRVYRLADSQAGRRLPRICWAEVTNHGGESVSFRMGPLPD